jgi:hypothetical protein
MAKEAKIGATLAWYCGVWWLLVACVLQLVARGAFALGLLRFTKLLIPLIVKANVLTFQCAIEAGAGKQFHDFHTEFQEVARAFLAELLWFAKEHPFVVAVVLFLLAHLVFNGDPCARNSAYCDGEKPW